jgi:MFS superfamily sulfate permease-like transporter
VGNTNTTALVISVLTILFLVGFAVLKRRRPDNRFLAKFPPILFAVVVGTLVSSAFDLASYGVVVLGHVDSGFERPSDSVPALRRTDILPVISKAAVLALLNFIEVWGLGGFFCCL